MVQDMMNWCVTKNYETVFIKRYRALKYGSSFPTKHDKWYKILSSSTIQLKTKWIFLSSVLSIRIQVKRKISNIEKEPMYTLNL